MISAAGTLKRANRGLLQSVDPESRCPRSLSERDEGYVRFLGSYFFASGHDREDIEQTARLGILKSGHRNGGRRDVLDLVKVARRRAFQGLPDGLGPQYDPESHLEARELLRSVLEAVRTDSERVAVGRALRGEPIGEKRYEVALHRFRRRVAA